MAFGIGKLSEEDALSLGFRIGRFSFRMQGRQRGYVRGERKLTIEDAARGGVDALWRGTRACKSCRPRRAYLPRATGNRITNAPSEHAAQLYPAPGSWDYRETSTSAH
jgi:hypothetical protein